MIKEEKENTRRVFPNYKVLVKINPDNPPTASNLTLTEWKVIMQVDGKKNLQNIIDELSIGEEESLAIFHELYKKNLIEIVVQDDVEEKLAGEEFFQNLENILVKIIGPVAVYIINDVTRDCLRINMFSVTTLPTRSHVHEESNNFCKFS